MFKLLIEFSLVSLDQRSYSLTYKVREGLSSNERFLAYNPGVEINREGQYIDPKPMVDLENEIEVCPMREIISEIERITIPLSSVYSGILSENFYSLKVTNSETSVEISWNHKIPAEFNSVSRLVELLQSRVEELEGNA